MKANSVVGITGYFQDPEDKWRLTSVGIQCVLCHSTVDDSFKKGIGRRLDGWPNRDLNVGEIVALAPTMKPFEDLLKLDDASIRKALRSWGPGRYDAELDKDGKATRPDGLEEVIAHYEKLLQLQLAAEERGDLLEYLKSL